MSQASSTLARLDRVTRRDPCPVCGKPDFCGVSRDRALVVCMRRRSDRASANGGWVHLLGARSERQQSPLPPRTRVSDESPVASIDRRDAVYTTLLRAHLMLAEEHRARLTKRGLSEDEFEALGYRSMPTARFAAGIARALSELTDLAHVPGFFRAGGTWQMVVWSGPGFLIPVRDEHARIQALLIRRDEAGDGGGKYVWLSSKGRPAGASSGAPLHFSKPHLVEKLSTAYITEGALKADVIAARLDAPVIALAGVSTFHAGFGVELRRRLPSLRRIEVAFDSDWRTNAAVKAQLFRLVNELLAAKLEVLIKRWPAAHKGFDDYLVEGRMAG